MKVLRTIAAIAACLSIGATYYIDDTGNDGLDGTTEANAWATWPKALGSTGINAGDTLIVLPGTWNFTSANDDLGPHDDTNGDSRSDKTYVIAQTRGTAIIDGGGSAVCWLWMAGDDNMVFEGLNFTSWARATNRGIFTFYNGATANEVRGCTFGTAGGDTMATIAWAWNGSGGAANASNATVVESCLVYEPSYFTIRASGSDSCQFNYNTITRSIAPEANSSTYGVYIVGTGTDPSDECEIIGNSFDKIYKGVDTAASTSADGLLMQNNTVVASYEHGLLVRGSDNCMVKGNLVRNTSLAALNTGFALVIQAGDACTLQSNTVVNCGDTAIWVKNGTTNAVIIDNIVASYTGDYAVQFQSAGLADTVDGNVYWVGDGTAPSFYDGTAVRTFSAWQGQGFDPNGWVMDPQLNASWFPRCRMPFTNSGFNSTTPGFTQSEWCISFLEMYKRSRSKAKGR